MIGFTNFVVYYGGHFWIQDFFKIKKKFFQISIFLKKTKIFKTIKKRP